MAITLKPLKPISDEDILKLSDLNPGYQLELDSEGELIVTPSGGESAFKEGGLFVQIYQWAEQNGSGRAFPSSAGFRLPDGRLFVPDASWTLKSRLNTLSREKLRRFLPLCPDAVFEIRSYSQFKDELQEKMKIYIANGARIAIFMDPYERIVELYRPGVETQVLVNPKNISLDPELPGFTLNIFKIFEEE
jgi:Uma2 family endonuclease